MLRDASGWCNILLHEVDPKLMAAKKYRKKLITINEIWTLKICTAWRRNVPSWSQSSYYFSITVGWAVDSCGVSHEDRTKCNYCDSNLLWTAFKVAESILLVNTFSRAFKWFLAAAPVIKLNRPCCICAASWCQVKAGGACSLQTYRMTSRGTICPIMSLHIFRVKHQPDGSVFHNRLLRMKTVLFDIFRQPLAISANSAAI